MMQTSGHPNIVQSYGIVEMVPSKVIGLVMEYCESSLKEYIAEQAKAMENLPMSLVQEAMRQIYCGLSFLHSDLKIVHR